MPVILGGSAQAVKAASAAGADQEGAVQPVLEIAKSQQVREAAQARDRELQELAWRRSVRRMLLQCVALMFLGVPLYAAAWQLTDARQAQLVATGAFVVSYVAPMVRLVVFHVRATGRGDY